MPVAKQVAQAKPRTGPLFWLVMALTAAILLPFAGKAAHVDDPLFLWTAQHVQQDVFDPYGFNVNWYGQTASIADVTKNPPLVAYYLAGAAWLGGWGTLALHLAMLIPAALAAGGTFLLASRLTSRPFLAAALAVLTPAFVVSATTLMCDVPMLAAWVFAVWFWLRGIDEGNHRDLAFATVLAAVASLTKYFGIALLPLLVLYAATRTPRRIAWWWHLAFPLAVLAAYHFVTARMYGHSLLLDAAGYATDPDPAASRFAPTSILVAFAFTGGCLATLAAVAPRLWSARVLVGGLIGAAVLAWATAQAPSLRGFRTASLTSTWPLAIQIACWALAGVSVLALAWQDWWQRRDAGAILLIVWVFGTFVFATFVNWTVNGRSVLPMAVPAAILAARRLEPCGAGTRLREGLTLGLPLAAAAALALAVAWSDLRIANTNRDLVERMASSLSASRLWFQGHWGFQYYMENWGARPIDIKTSPMRDGDVIAIPYPNVNLFPVPPDVTRPRGSIEAKPGGWVTTMDPAAGAGFYGGLPLPFVFGQIPIHTVHLVDVVLR